MKLVVICSRVTGKRVTPDVRDHWFPVYLSKNPVKMLPIL